VFPPMVVQMINVGEQAGGWNNMLTKIADFYDDEVDVAVEVLLAAMESIMVVVVGGHDRSHVPAHLRYDQRGGVGTATALSMPRRPEARRCSG
jgi:hypothetical protein